MQAPACVLGFHPSPGLGCRPVHATRASAATLVRLPAKRVRRSGILAAVLLALVATGCGSKGRSKQEPRALDPDAPILTAPGTPTGAPVGRTIGAAGGTLASPDGRLVLTVPPGAVASDTSFSVQPVTSTAIGGVGGAYRLEPDDQVTLLKPVTLVLRGPETYASGTSIADLGVGYQDASGFWFRAREVQRDASANTLTVTTNHFSDWGVVWQAGVPGLYGSFTLQQTIGVPFTGTGTATLFYQGDNPQITLYVATGSITVPSQLPWQGGTCSPEPAAVTSTVVPTVAEIWRSPTQQFRWSINGQWALACTGAGGGAAPPVFMSSMFDSLGINLVGCARGYVTPPIIGTDHVKGSYVIDCGTQGRVTASWDLIPCIPGVQCTSSTSACNEAVISCDTGQPVCTDTGRLIAAGTTCGEGMVCDPAGACSACTGGTACTPPGACTAWETSCATGVETCVDTLAPLGTGAACGANMVCDAAGTCVACTAGLGCTPDGSCTAWTTSCASGASVCTDTGVPLGTGASCGTNQVCGPAGACVACTAGTTCTPAGSCTRWETSCATGASVCVDTGVALGTGASCGTDQVCDPAGTCVGCTAGVDCTPPGACTRHLTSCSTGTSVCVDSGQLLGTGATCGTNMVCDPTGTCVSCTAGTSCTPPGSCTLWQTSCGSGAERCVDTTTPLATGASCDAGRVCDPAGQCIACVEGQDCTPPNACTMSRIACGSGAPVCTPTAEPVAPGTTCGTGLVCDGAGTCAACTQDLLCTPPGSCFEHRIDCSTGAPVCNPTATPTAPGSSCGSGLVCNGAGGCISCVEGQDCTLAGACTQSRIACSSGAPVCTPSTDPVAGGTTCGPGQVCDGLGACVVCTAGTTCTPTGSCTRWETSCATGTSVCVDTLVPLGTAASCGPGMVCDPIGQCVACVQGQDCTQLGACVQSQIACTTGSPVCTATTAPVGAGASCGENQVCNGTGTCVACTAGVDCTPAGSCTVWQTSCSTGSSVCVDTGVPLTDGVACGSFLVCSAGRCTCDAGASCPPSDACHSGAVVCDPTAGPTCAQTALPQGTSCGTGLACDGAGTCVCAQGADCTPENACTQSRIECGSGSPICTPTTDPVVAGTTCGTNLACDGGGACVCAQGVDCTPEGACLVSLVECGTGSPVCTETATPVLDGTLCGPTLTQQCVGGVCQPP